ncbi:hypothetical protein ACFY1S_07965 [Micromonospora sp. NPDC000663]|uniref:hypothetical protein n=1 Tax=Micromonospora sp. NPDC000663 TaxID=3364218 RepID=UPI003673C9F2
MSAWKAEWLFSSAPRRGEFAARQLWIRNRRGERRGRDDRLVHPTGGAVLLLVVGVTLVVVARRRRLWFTG